MAPTSSVAASSQRAAADGREPAVEDSTTSLLRRVLLGLAALTMVGTVLELASLGHWKEPVQILPFLCVVVLAVPTALLFGSPSAAVVKAARAIAVVVCLASVFGMFEHVHGNYESGPLDGTYGDQWDTMSVASRWWLALIKTVGPSPALAPGVLALSALCVFGATLRHPALGAPVAD